MIFKGRGVVFFEDSGISLIMFSEKIICKFQRNRELRLGSSRISLIVFSEKSYMNKRGTGLPIKAKKEYILQGTKYTLFIIYYELQQHQIYIRNKSANIMHSFIFCFFISNSFLQFQAFSLNSLFLIHLYYQKLNFLRKNHLFYKLVHKIL